MKDIIINKLNQIEEKENIKILFAIDSGSRTWNFASYDSDYDIRFIYCHPLDWYLSLEAKRDVIEYPINNLLDINGWDIRKALLLFSKSNISIMEWINSPIIYLDKYSLLDKLHELESEFFSVRTSLHHYINMAITNNRNLNEKVKTKTYFYVLRPLLACIWIEKYQSVPPIDFEILFNTLIDDQGLKNDITKLLQNKRNGNELDLHQKINSINNFIDNNILYYQKLLKTFKNNDIPNIEKLNELFRNTLDEIW